MTCCKGHAKDIMQMKVEIVLVVKQWKRKNNCLWLFKTVKIGLNLWKPNFEQKKPRKVLTTSCLHAHLPISGVPVQRSGNDYTSGQHPPRFEPQTRKGEICSCCCLFCGGFKSFGRVSSSATGGHVVARQPKVLPVITNIQGKESKLTF